MFSRRREGGRHHAKTDDRKAWRAALLEQDEPNGAAPKPARVTGLREPEGPSGPYDFDEAPLADRIDLGSLLLPSVDGVEVRAQAEENGAIQQLVLVNAGNVLQLGAFAAPRTDSLWDEWRAEIRRSLFDDGVAADEVRGAWGMELRARLRTQDGFTELRFIGIDGPRWMVYGAMQGPGAVDPALAEPLINCLRGLVVRRGEEARPTREPLPLHVPGQPAAGPEPELEQAEPPRRRPSPRPRRF